MRQADGRQSLPGLRRRAALEAVEATGVREQVLQRSEEVRTVAVDWARLAGEGMRPHEDED